MDGYLFAPPGDFTDVLDKELAAAHRVGLTDVERVIREALHGGLVIGGDLGKAGPY